LDNAEVMITSGAQFSRIKVQVLDRLDAKPSQLTHLHVMPANGSSYYRYDLDSQSWRAVYVYEIPAKERRRLVALITKTAKKLNYWTNKPHGKIVEDRGSEITYSGDGQQATLAEKTPWDPKGTKRRRLRSALARLLPGYSVRTAGLTSVDVTLQGVTKATALARLKEILGLHQNEAIYIGDAMGPGGNDAVVKQAGFKTYTTSGPDQTAKLIDKLLESFK
jgi:hydroxymethylpyrimidine pyrophosphatase-like HAD family hydrolase